MLKEKLSIERKKAVMITADFTAPTTESYAMAWLRLCNNAREYKDVIWRIENDSGNKVYVWCDPKYKETVIEFLTGIVYYYQEDKGPTSEEKAISALENFIENPDRTALNDEFVESLKLAVEKLKEVKIDGEINT